MIFGIHSDFSLDARLAQDTVPLGDLVLSRALAVNDANYPWLILVPRRAGVTELIELAEEDQTQLLREISATAAALKAVTACDKLNIAALGNAVPQLHVHIIARRHYDPAWPKPVWGAVPARPYEEATLEKLLSLLRQKLAPMAR